MANENLTFKLVLDADISGLINSARVSEQTLKNLFDTIRQEAENLRQKSEQTAQDVADIIPDTLASDANEAAQAIDELGSAASDLSDQSGAASDAASELTDQLGGATDSASGASDALSDLSQSADDLNSAASDASDATSDIVQTETQTRVSQLVSALHLASLSLNDVGDDASVSAENLRMLGEYGANALSGLKAELDQARLHLNYLAATNATPEDIANAQAQVRALELGVRQVETAFNGFQSAADAAVEASEGLGDIIPSDSIEVASSLASNLSNAADAIRDAGDGAKSTANEFSDFGKAAERALERLKNDLEESKQRLEDFSNTNATPEEIEAAQQEVDRLAREVQAADDAFSDFQSEVDNANSSLEDTSSVADQAQKGIEGVQSAYGLLAGALAAVGIGWGVQELADMADSYTNLSTRIHIATKDGGDFAAAMSGVHQVALATNSSLSATGDLFTRLNDVGKDAGLTQQQILNLTQTITQAIQVGGGSAQASEAAITQLIQAMQGGVLRGEEFNSIMENGFGLAEALARGLGVTTGELRKMAENGELSAERVVLAIQKQANEVQKTYDQFPLTIGNALQRISTSWEGLIGQMDQANGASATVADWLVVLSDNIGVVKYLLDDMGDGFIWVGDQLKKIDTATIEALKTALITTYESLKNVAATLGATFEITFESVNSALDKILFFESGMESVSGKTNGFTKLLQSLNVVVGFVGDGFSAIGIGANMLAGAIYDVAAAFVYWKSKFLLGEAKEQALKEYEELRNKSKGYYQESSNDAMEFKSKGIEAIQEIGKTQEQKNTESVEGNRKKLDELLEQDAKFNADTKTLADERSELDKQLNQARIDDNQALIASLLDQSTALELREKEAEKSKIESEAAKLEAVKAYAEAAIKANNGVLSGVTQADLITKGYIVTVDTAGKVSVQASQNSAEAAVSAAQKEELVRVAKENVKRADEEYLAFQKKAAIERALLEKQIEEAKKSGDLNALVSAQSALDAIDAKETEFSKNRENRIAEHNRVITGSGDIAAGSADKARKAAQALGIDLDVALNRLSEKFVADKVNLTNYANGLQAMGVTGARATELIYEGWEIWAEKAKSSAELDAAKAQLISFEKQGVFSAKQVQMGMEYLDQVNGKLPQNISEVEKAYKQLGLTSQAEASKIADAQIRAFNVLQQSGTASMDQLKQALLNMADKIYASGDAAKIAAYESKLAYAGLETQVDSTGKTAVKSMDDLGESAHRVSRSFGNMENSAVSSIRNIKGETEEATKAAEKWYDAVSKMKTDGPQSGTKAKLAVNAEAIEAELLSYGYDAKRAKQLAKDIYEGTRDGLSGYKTELIKGFETGTSVYSNTTMVNRELDKYKQYAPGAQNVSAVVGGAASASSGPTKTIEHKFMWDGKEVTLQGKAGEEDALNQLISQLKTQGKSS